MSPSTLSLTDPSSSPVPLCTGGVKTEGRRDLKEIFSGTVGDLIVFEALPTPTR